MSDVIQQIDDASYLRPSTHLNGSTLGQHFRHAIEFFECLAQGYESGIVCYDNRDHDKTIESSRLLAMEVIDRVKSFINGAVLSQQLTLEVSYNQENDEEASVETNLARELVYNIEHVVHHMALVKIGLRELMPHLVLPHDFGIAVSTIKYRRSQA